MRGDYKSSLCNTKYRNKRSIQYFVWEIETVERTRVRRRKREIQMELRDLGSKVRGLESVDSDYDHVTGC